jgi:hypothetical protein
MALPAAAAAHECCFAAAAADQPNLKGREKRDVCVHALVCKQTENTLNEPIQYQ